MLLDLDAVFGKLPVKVILQALKAKSVAILVFPIVVTVFLKAIVRKMHVVILV
jgi:hypothetical protein